MRICKFVIIVGLLSLLFPGCKKHYSSSALIVCNESGEELWVESYIVSASCDSTKSFLLQEGRSKSVVLATSEKYEKVNNADSFLKRCVYNEDAYVRVYKVDDYDERVLVRNWSYANRNNDGHELFNETCIEQSIQGNAAGDAVVSYLFTILPEDISGSTID